MPSDIDNLSPVIESSPFKIGGKEIAVPTLTLWDLERLRAKIDSIQPNMDWVTYPQTILQIVAALLSPDSESESEATYTKLARACSIHEMRNLGEMFNTLLIKSGFLMPGEAEAAMGNPGTGTSTVSPPTSPSVESAGGTQSASSVH